jgi:hypothetical protein
MDNIIAAYAWPLGGATVSLAVHWAARKWIFRSNSSRDLLTNVFVAAAISTYYWYCIPALTGFGPHPGSMVLLDLSSSWPHLPWVSRFLTTSFFAWFFLLRKNVRVSWMTRPARVSADA